MQADPPFSEDIQFHSQQAVEKTLKAFLSWHRTPFRKTHNLVELGDACCQIEASLELLLRGAAPLTEYAWKFRYRLARHLKHNRSHRPYQLPEGETYYQHFQRLGLQFLRLQPRDSR